MSISGIALTGIRASQMRLTASASNVANSVTTAAPGDAAAYRPLSVQQSPQADGGVSARTVASGDSVLRYAPGAAKADANGMVAAPDVDLTQEAVEQRAAVQDFKANVKVFAAQDDMTRSTLELWG